MISRQTSSLFASLLVLIQLLVSPLAHSSPTAHDGCGDTGQTTHATATAMRDCGDCPDGQATTLSDTSNSDHHCRTQVACTWPGAHTPALGAIRLIVANPTPPEDVVGELTVPSFDSPLFDFLRPPN